MDCAESYVDLSPHLDKSPIQITEKTPLDRVIEMFRYDSICNVKVVSLVTVLERTCNCVLLLFASLDAGRWAFGTSSSRRAGSWWGSSRRRIFWSILNYTAKA